VAARSRRGGAYSVTTSAPIVSRKSEALFDLLSIFVGERHGDVRTYLGEVDGYYVAASRCARKRIRDAGNRVWVWSEPMGAGLALVSADPTAPAQQHRFRRLTDTEDRTAFELMLEEGVEPDSLVFRCKPWPFRGLMVSSLNALRGLPDPDS